MRSGYPQKININFKHTSYSFCEYDVLLAKVNYYFYFNRAEKLHFVFLMSNNIKLSTFPLVKKKLDTYNELPAYDNDF